MDIQVFAENYRGFKTLELDLSKPTFITGDNSSGKSSILLLLNYVFNTGLFGTPALDRDSVFDKYDFFSPYFTYANVTIGFRTKEKGSYSGRVITIEQSKLTKEAMTIKMTWFKGDKALSFSNSKKGLKVKKQVLSHNELADINQIKTLHHSESGYKRLDSVSPALREDLFAKPEMFLFLLLDYKDQNDKKTGTKKASGTDKERNEWLNWAMDYRHFSKPILPKAKLTDPIRKPANRIYEAELETGTQKSNFVSDLSSIERENYNEGLKLIEDFGRKSRLFDSIKARNIDSESSVLYLFVELEKNGKKLFLDQFGTGVAQVLPIIVEAAIVKKNKERNLFLLLQQPELHLHPMAQAELGSFFYKMIEQDLHYVIETHSDYLIDRFRADMKENPENKTEAQIIFCENDASGNHYHKIDIKKDGGLGNVPKTYKDFFVKELIRTM